ncbi:MAG: FKBP-type peptidyl-prolyl cis-trans isomerase [Saprospiraceae bacterium]|nr:FKBP-type peptidyl-prolyl cis-trans isomerase [Saprospiraceae bacterium]
MKGDTFEEQIDQIKDFMARKNWKADTILSEGVYVVIDEEGSSEKPTIQSTVTVNYKGYYYDEEVFDEGQDLELNLTRVIKGWQLGIPQFGKGGKGKLLITSDKAYGEGNGIGIRPNAMLIFEIEVIDFK